MSGFEFNPGEKVFADTSRYTLQGNKVKFPVHCRCVITDQRFVYFDMGKMAPFHFQLGSLFRLMMKGKPVSFLLQNIKLSRGKYARNKRTVSVAADDGREILLDNFDKTLQWFQNVLQQNGMNLTQTGEEEWRITG
ncbi:MAG: hypothetical protein U9P42_05730 [Candidatus Fermentibacteria bacterium]|nr:hypothetical protein [Candidatus Fermentibacteria bacterium]